MFNISKFYIRQVLQNFSLYKRCLAGDAIKIKKPSNVTLEQVQKGINDETKKDLRWHEKKEQSFSSKLKLFGNEEQTSDFIVMMQKPLDLRSLHSYWEQRKLDNEKYMQKFLVERHNILGPDLAAAHFILFRGGSLKFLNSSRWIAADKNGEFKLPNRYDPSFKLEALKCDNMRLHYEGLENLRWLQWLKFISFRNVKTFDDWCLDRVSGLQFPQLEVLDISSTICTNLSLSCLYRINTLKLLVMDDPKESLQTELTCAMLMEVLPKLKIMSANEVHGVITDK